MSERLLKIEEVAMTIDSSIQTINNWYRFKRLYPDNEFATILPDYVQRGTKQTRYWKSSDMWKLIEFKNKIPHGRNGVLGAITRIKNKGAKSNDK